MKSITIPELNQILHPLNPKQLIVDVRTPEEFNAGHLPTALNIPHQEILDHIELLKKFDSIAVYCKAGGRAVYACEELELNGFTNLSCVDYGGYSEWAKQFGNSNY